MSPTTHFAVLALASTVLAIPYAGHHGHAAHQHAHRRQVPPVYGSSSSSAAAAIPYPMTNGTTTRSSELSPQSPTLIPTGYSSSTSIAEAVPTPYGSSSSEADAIPTSGSSSANGLPTAYGSSSTDVTTTTTIRSTSTSTSYTTIYLSKASSTSASVQAPSSSIADSESASPYGEAKQVAANTAVSNAPSSTEAEQCGAVTVTATQHVTEYVTISPSSTPVAPVADKSSVPASSIVSSSSALYHANSTQYAPTAYSSASYSIPAPSSNSSEAAAVPATSSSAPAYSAPAYSTPSSSSEAAAIPTSAPSAPAYSAPSSSSEAAAITTSAASAPAYSVPTSSSSSEAAPVATSESSTATSSATSAAILPTSYVNKGLAGDVATSSSSAPASYSSAASSTGGKRGLAYNDASLTDCFTGGSEITWAYNWGSSAGDLASGLKFIPTLWGTGSDFTGSWSENAKSAISSGSSTLFSFNEPDLAAQANLSPAAAATAYKTYMEPLGDSAKLCAPSVTNSGTDGQGLSWLSEFLEACSDCQIDCINIHWYDSAENTDYFKSHVEKATSIANGKPVYVSEFGATGSDDQITSFLEEVMPWMDSNSDIAGYAYFMVESGVLVTGTEPSTYGSVYKSYTS